MGEDGRAIAFHVFVEPDAGASLGQYAHESGFADLKRIAPQASPFCSIRSKAYRNVLSSWRR
jgi:hypothetical protein